MRENEVKLTRATKWIMELWPRAKNGTIFPETATILQAQERASKKKFNGFMDDENDERNFVLRVERISKVQEVVSNHVMPRDGGRFSISSDEWELKAILRLLAEVPAGQTVLVNNVRLMFRDGGIRSRAEKTRHDIGPKKSEPLTIAMDIKQVCRTMVELGRKIDMMPETMPLAKEVAKDRMNGWQSVFKNMGQFKQNGNWCLAA